MKKTQFIILVLLNFVLFSYSQDIIQRIEALDHHGKYQEALTLLLQYYQKDQKNLSVNWHLAMMTFEVANIVKSKQDKIELYETGINATKNFLNINFNKCLYTKFG